MPSLFSAPQRLDYARDGFVVIRQLFDAEEIGYLRDAIETDPQLRESLYDRHDASGKATRMATWNHPGDSVYGLAARTHRVVDTMEDMLGGEVYHYHSKLTAKEPKVGGAWEWHQDYGYWYHNGCVFPYMASVMVALDKTTRENGCLQGLRGSHLAGRVDHAQRVHDAGAFELQQLAVGQRAIGREVAGRARRATKAFAPARRSGCFSLMPTTSSPPARSAAWSTSPSSTTRTSSFPG